MSVPAVPAPTPAERFDAEMTRAFTEHSKTRAEAAESECSAESDAAYAAAEAALLAALRSAARGYADAHAAQMVERYARRPYPPEKAHRGEPAG